MDNSRVLIWAKVEPIPQGRKATMANLQIWVISQHWYKTYPFAISCAQAIFSTGTRTNLASAWVEAARATLASGSVLMCSVFLYQCVKMGTQNHQMKTVFLALGPTFHPLDPNTAVRMLISQPAAVRIWLIFTFGSKSDVRSIEFIRKFHIQWLYELYVTTFYLPLLWAIF